jgi:competence protein ComEC
LIYILKHFHVKQVISTHHASDSPVYKDFMDLIRKNDISHPNFAQTQRTFTINDATVEILHPDADFMERHPSSSPKDINNYSIVVKVGFGGFSILFPGDIMRAAEKDMVLKMPQSLTADMLVAPHHGSKTSSSPAFLDAVDPEVIVVSSGKEGHFPSKSVVERYEKRGVPIFRTDHNGAVRVIMDGETMTVEPMLGNNLKN